MNKWIKKLPLIRQRIAEGVTSVQIAEELGTTLNNLHKICHRNQISLAAAAPFNPEHVKPGIVYDIPLDQLRRDRGQPRKQFDAEDLQALAAALTTEGQETPIKFRVATGEERANHLGEPLLIIVHGERRFRAAQLAKLDTLQGVLDTSADDNAGRIMRQISDNAQRADLTPYDYFLTICELHTEHKLSAKAISEAFTERGLRGFSRSVVANYLRIDGLPVAAQDLLEQGRITPAHCKYLLMARDPLVLDKVIAELTEAETPYTTAGLVATIDYKYNRRWPGLNKWSSAQIERTTFDWKTECKGCEHCHSISRDIGAQVYCAEPGGDCWKSRQAAHDRRQAIEEEKRQAEQQAEQEVIETVDLETLRESDPEEADRIEAMRQENEERKRQAAQHQAEHDRKQAWKAELADKAAGADLALQVAILAVEMLDPAGEAEIEEGRELDYWLNRTQIDAAAIMAEIMREKLRWPDYLDTDDLARYLGMPAQDDYQVPDGGQGDLLTEAAA